MSDAYDHKKEAAALPPPFTVDGRSVFEDPEAFRRRFLMSVVLGPPLSKQRGAKKRRRR